MRNALGKIAILAILVATIGFGLNTLFNQPVVTYLSTDQIDGIIYYHYDFYGYIKGIVNTLETTPDLILHTPTRQWIYNASDITQVGTMIGNDLAVVLDWMIFGINVIIYPFRIIFYVVKLALTILGINMTTYGNSLDWVKATADTFIKLEIPYI